MTEEQSEIFKGIVQLMEEDIPFNKAVGLKIPEIRKGFVRMLIPFQDMLVGDTRRPALHGGVLSMLIDTAGGAAVWSNFTRNDAVSTVDIRVDYLNPAPKDTLICESTVQRFGNRVAVVHSVVFSQNEPDKILAEGRGVYNIKVRK